MKTFSGPLSKPLDWIVFVAIVSLYYTVAWHWKPLYDWVLVSQRSPNFVIFVIQNCVAAAIQLLVAVVISRSLIHIFSDQK